jgi:hypothetical protein
MADEGFLSRWSKRKADARGGKAVEAEPVVPPVVETPPPSPSPQPSPASGRGSAAEEEAVPPPTLEEAQSLSFESDFKRFVAPDVPSEVKNAAVKKLFADPRFNVRDAMDVYADDYSQPDPLPDDMLRKLASAQFLKLFEDDADTAENADDAGKQTVAQSPQDADADLRLQQDDAAAGESAGDGAERGTSAAHDAVPPGSGRVPEGDPGK